MRDVFQQAADRLSPGALEVWVGAFNDCTVLKLYKNTWANPGENPLTAVSRIFFSVWIAPKREGLLFYNIHALKLRHLKGYKIESRRFAETFRKAFSKHARSWKNVSTDFGPLTLMQGHVEIEPERLEDQIVALSNNFLQIGHLIDETLALFH